jgi:predicted nuclease of restriction endonuclease-like (RecB) superfamily
MNFNFLVSTIEQTHRQFQQQAAKAINIQLTMRNWLIGFYIVEFEQAGEDRANYGTGVIDALAEKMIKIKGVDRRSLFRFKEFYLMYPQIKCAIVQQELISAELASSVLPQSWYMNADTNRLGKVGSATPQLQNNENQIDAWILITKLSYSHIEQLLAIEDASKRRFYEKECIQGTWSIRELRRQINSLYYERSRMSQKPDKLRESITINSKTRSDNDFIKSVYAFEFLDLNLKDVVEESDLEKALVDHLQEFMLELGHGFCLEARQKKILIGDTYYFIDLVFYHRILKCHVLVELKVDAFDHAHISQLNTYVNYYRQEVKSHNDKPPVGILLVTNKNQSLVEYATAGMDNRMFVSKYLLKLPSKELLQDFISSEIKDWKLK